MRPFDRYISNNIAVSHAMAGAKGFFLATCAHLLCRVRHSLASQSGTTRAVRAGDLTRKFARSSTSPLSIMSENTTSTKGAAPMSRSGNFSMSQALSDFGPSERQADGIRIELRAQPGRQRCREGRGDVLGALPRPPGAMRSKLVSSVQFYTDSYC